MKLVPCAGCALLLALLVAATSARPSPGSDPEPWQPVTSSRRNRPLFRNEDGERGRESKSQEESKEAAAVVEGAGVGVTEGVGSTSPTPISESLKMVTKQLLSPLATDMVVTDVRTPPKVKTQIGQEFVPIGKGEAIPLDGENLHSYQVVADVKAVESTPASGISTWILLNNNEQSTQASQKKQAKPQPQPAATQAPPKKKAPKPATEAKNATAQKLETRQAGIVTKVENPKKTQSINQDPLVKVPALMLQDAKFRNKTPVVVGKVPAAATTKTKPEVTVKKGNTTAVPVSVAKIEALAPQSVRRKVAPTAGPATTASTETPRPVYQYEMVPTTSVVVHTDLVEAETTEEVGTTEPPAVTTTKRTRKPVNKKKKKNKNRRRRPAKKPEGVVESKVTEDGNATRITQGGSRPLSTRIYNYLSREIMPSVGVGIVGLMLTAGLAGLFLYPFGGGIAARRTYEKTPGPSDSNPYYYNDYSGTGEVDNGQAEESVFGQVLAGMQQSENKYEKYPSGSRPSSAGSQTHYGTQSKYRYDPSHEYGYQSAYQSKDKYASGDVSTTIGRNPDGYSTLPDSASLSSKYSPSYSSSQYSAPGVITQYGESKYPAVSGTVYSDKYSSVDGSNSPGGIQYSSPLETSASSDNSETKYSTLTGLSVEPQNTQYTSLTDEGVKYSQSSKYSSLSDDQESKYDQNPKYTSLTDSHTSYSSLTDAQKPKYTSLTDNKESSKFSSTDDKSSKYPTEAEYTAYSNPSDIGTQSGSYSASNHKNTAYTDIEYDDTKSLPSLNEEDKSDKSQPTFSALHSDDAYSNLDSMSMFSGSFSQNEVRHRQGVLAVEHGPRNIKLERRRRQVDEKHNEVDAALPEEQTTTERVESSTDNPTTENQKETHQSTVESTTWKMPKEPEFTTTMTPPSRDHGFFGFLRRLAQMKLRMGLELLRSTTHAVARYLDTVQKRMETVVRDMDKKTERQRRDLAKKLV